MNRLDYAPQPFPLVGFGSAPLSVQQRVLAATDEGDPVFKHADTGKRLAIPFLLVLIGVGVAVWAVDKELDERLGKD